MDDPVRSVTMKRRDFIRSLGGAVAAAMMPFSKPIRLSAPKKPKAETLLAFWVQTAHRRYYTQAYLDYMEMIMASKGVNFLTVEAWDGRLT